jgi:hypothetical protein
VNRIVKEIKAKDRGMRIAAENNAGLLEQTRKLAHIIGQRMKEGITIENVRDALEFQGIKFTPGNWMGSIFKSKAWEKVGYRQSTHKDGHARIVSVWRLK